MQMGEERHPSGSRLLSATEGIVRGSFYIMSFHGLITIGLLGFL